VELTDKSLAMTHSMRRAKQQLPDDEAKQILKEMSNGTLAVCGSDGFPYAVPLSYVYADNAIYFHSALCGHKVDAIKGNPNVSFCVVKQDQVVPEKLTTFYRSVIVFGKASLVTDKTLQEHALRLLGEKYCKGLDLTNEISKYADKVAVIRLNIEHITGKEAKELTNERPEIKHHD
jgi:hypothetical protein